MGKALTPKKEFFLCKGEVARMSLSEAWKEKHLDQKQEEGVSCEHIGQTGRLACPYGAMKVVLSGKVME